MLFSGQSDGPRDGIYKECQLFFEEGSLFFIHLGEKKFIASIDDYVPVHSYHPGKGENQTLPAKELFKNMIQADIAVVALNAKGMRVSAVYVMEKADVDDLATDVEDEAKG